MSDAFEEKTGLAVLENIKLPSALKIGEEMGKSFGTMYAELESRIADLDGDMSLAKNREAARSLAYKISQTKVAIVNSAKGSVEEFTSIVKAVTGERTKMEKEFDALRDKAREKLTAWEETEKSRQDRVSAERQKLGSLPASSSLMTADQLREAINSTDVSYSGEVYGEDAHDLIALRERTRSELCRMLEKREDEEKERAELEQLRREKAEREAAETARIAEEECKAQEAAEQQRQTEERAWLARVAEERANAVKVKNAETITARFAGIIERAKPLPSAQIANGIEFADSIEITEDAYPVELLDELEELKAKTIATLKDMAVTRAGEEQEAAERQIAERKEAERKAEIERQEQQKEAAARAEAQAKEREERAAATERARIETEKANQEEAERARAADVAHRKKINSAAVKALVTALEVNETFAQQIVTAIYKGQIPHVKIEY